MLREPSNIHRTIIISFSYAFISYEYSTDRKMTNYKIINQNHLQMITFNKDTNVNIQSFDI